MKIKLIGAILCALLFAGILYGGVGWFLWVGYPQTASQVLHKMVAAVGPLLLSGVFLLISLNLYRSYNFDLRVEEKLAEFDRLPEGSPIDLKFRNSAMLNEFFKQRNRSIRGPLISKLSSGGRVLTGTKYHFD